MKKVFQKRFGCFMEIRYNGASSDYCRDTWKGKTRR
jgi:hypothetical protein